MSNGEFVWFDYYAGDVDKAIAFYTEVVGWKTQQWSGGDYTMFAVGQEPIGGVMQLPEAAAQMGAPPHWLAFVQTGDVDKAAARAAELGGQVRAQPFDIPGVGRAAVLQDPQGAVFAAFRPARADFETLPGDKPGAFAWAELMTSDWEAAFAFYSDVFGWTKDTAMDMGPEGTYQLFAAAGKQVGGMMNMPEMVPMPNWLYYIGTDDLDAAIGRVEAHGGSKVHGPMDVPGGRVAVFMDNQGGMFAMHEMAR